MGFVTPQIHVVFAELFSTVANHSSEDLEDSVWPQLWQFQTCRFISDDDPASRIHANWLTQDKKLNCQREDRDNFIRSLGHSPAQQENEVIRAIENFNWDLPKHLDLLETQRTEVAQESIQESEEVSAQGPSQETGAAYAQETEGTSAQETEGTSAQETEGVSNPTSNHPRRQVRRGPRYFNNDFINLVISKINGHLQNNRSLAITSPFSFKSQKPNQQLDRNLCYLNNMKWNDFSNVLKVDHRDILVRLQPARRRV